MLEGAGFRVEVGALEAAGRAVKQAVADQGSFALRGLAGETSEYGHEPLRNALMDFCVRWSKTIDDLVDGGDDIGNALQASASKYREFEHAAKGALPHDDPAVDVADG